MYRICCPRQSLILQATREEPREGCSSSREPSCSPVSSSAPGASAAGASRGTTVARSTHPRSDCCLPPYAGLCSSSEGAAEAATSSHVLAEKAVHEGSPAGSETQQSLLLQPGQFSPESLGLGGWGCGSACSELG